MMNGEKNRKKLDPRIKLLFLVATGIISFFAGKPIFLICLFLPGAILYLHEKWFGQALRLSASFLVLMAVQIILLHVHEANTLTMILGIILFYGLRLFPIYMLFHWLIETTTISEWMKSMELMRMPKGFIITTATLLRYTPSIAHEFFYIKNTMKMRGIGMSVLSFMTKPISMMEYCLTPLLLRSVKIAEDLSAAAMTRGIENPVKRESYFEVRIGKKDVLAVICYGVWIAGAWMLFAWRGGVL